MRIWTIHPRYLDAKGLVALWREGLLAQKVLQGQTRGYRHHPQLIRFREEANPVKSMATYLHVIYEEASKRGYRFDCSKISRGRAMGQMCETRGQLKHEWSHLMKKLKTRDPVRFDQLIKLKRPRVHPLFKLEPGGVQEWERA
ncbi:MAG: pyrimidine dimer DNA glycosylase/endonuclease V [Verrucomicrobiota bacterium]|nr:pyrimidine dimer DNA glycosylase/endonuclease V [Verrucomicrobiota bacterium]